MQAEIDLEEAEVYRREAMGAFAHEVRTPLTSIKMVMELARRQSTGGQLLIDTELAEMLKSSVDDLQQLADDLQETSRLERGKANLSPGPADLSAAFEAARDLVSPVQIASDGVPAVEGPWDAPRLARAIAGFAHSANRIGDGSGCVRLHAMPAEHSVSLSFTSGSAGGESKPMAADAGFSFFRSRQLVLAMGGSVHCQRAERYAAFDVVLPLRRDGEER
jgi:signal transduction histidine kinase